MMCVDSIFVEDHIYHAVLDEIILPFGSLFAKRHLTITCPHDCLLTGKIALVSQVFHPTLHITFINTHFHFSTVFVQNIHLEFISLQFKNSSLEDVEPRAGEKGEVWLSNKNVSYFSGTVSLTKVFSTYISISNSVLEWTEVHLKPVYLSLMMTNSMIFQSYINTDVGNLTILKIEHCVVQLSLPDKGLFLHVASRCLMFHLTELSVQNTSGGISVETKQSPFLTSWLQISILRCVFQTITKSTSGGSLSVQFFPPNIKWSITNFVQITNTTFHENEVVRKQLQNAFGGAVSIVSDNPSDGALLFVDIQHCAFSDNQASDGGGALFVSGAFVHAGVKYTHFSLSFSPHFPSKPLFVFSDSTISISNSLFTVPNVYDTTPVNHLEVLSSAHEIDNLTLKFKCPPWHWLQVNSDFGTSSINGKRTLQRLSMKCASCPMSFYFKSDGNFLLTYETAQTSIKISDSQSDTEELGCIQCPYGATCPGNALNSKPNFWGFEMVNDYSFVQCPSGYCCSGADSNPCRGYRSCSANRQGVLCGACQTNYSLSLLSNSCMPNHECDDNWFWPAALLGIVFYMIWYTFKDEIISLPHLLIKKAGDTSKLKEKGSEERVDKGYFGIMIYFIQATVFMRIEMQGNSNRFVDKFFQETTMYISVFLTVELKYFSHNICPSENVDAIQKTRLKYFFLCGIFSCWLFVYICAVIIGMCSAELSQIKRFKTTLMSGLVEIVKYTYGGFTDIAFYSLAYTSVSGELVWFHDGTVKYFSTWQCEMIAFAIFYIIPFPFILYYGLNLLQKMQISSFSFLCSLFMPLPTFLYWLFIKKTPTGKYGNQSVNNKQNKIFNKFKGCYKEFGIAPFWESIMILRRLLLGSTALIPNPVIQLSLCLTLSIFFLVHHEKVQPFKHQTSNKAEGFSLVLLCGVAFFNAYKAFFIHMGLSALNDEITNNLTLLETMFVLMLVFYIVVMEMKTKFKIRDEKHF